MSLRVILNDEPLEQSSLGSEEEPEAERELATTVSGHLHVWLPLVLPKSQYKRF